MYMVQVIWESGSWCNVAKIQTLEEAKLEADWDSVTSGTDFRVVDMETNEVVYMSLHEPLVDGSEEPSTCIPWQKYGF